MFKEEGVGGVLYILRGEIVKKFKWILREMTNNKKKEYAILQGIKLITSHQINKLIVFDDSSLIIKHMISNTSPSDIHLDSIIARIWHIGKILEAL
jgi:ribonuclease HI